MKHLIRGLVTIVPVFLSLYAVVFVLGKIESTLKDLLAPLLPFTDYWPGFFLVLALGITYALGWLMSYSLAQKGQKWLENLLTRIPVVRTIYGPLRDLALLLSQSPQQLGQPALVTLDTSNPVHLVGFITNEQWSEQNDPTNPDLVSVFIPLSFALGGVTILVHKSQIRRLSISRQKAFSSALAAWVPTLINQHKWSSD